MSKHKTNGNSRKQPQEKTSALREDSQRAAGGELHETAGAVHSIRTTNQGVAIAR